MATTTFSSSIMVHATLLALCLSLSPQTASAFVFPSPPDGTTRSIMSRLGYANAANPPSLSDVGQSSFEERMRKLVREQDAQKRRQPRTKLLRSTKQKKQQSRPAFLTEVSTLPEYKAQVADETNRISVVRFYSPYCRACKAATPAFDQLARKHPQLNWVEVPVTQANNALHQGLGISTVPFGHIYVPGTGLVEELRMVRSQMNHVGKVLQSYVDGECDLPERVYAQTGIYEAPTRDTRSRAL